MDVRNSDFLRLHLRDGDDPTIGEGLFSHYAYRRNNVIAEFHGVLMTREAYDEDAALNGRGGYCVELRLGQVLQTYDSRWNGDCLASCANSATRCTNVSTGRNAINNCRLSVSHTSNTVKLVCDSDYIAPHTELAYNYGPDFMYPAPRPLA